MSLFQRAKNTLSFTVEIECPVSVVYEHLAHPRNFLGLQPLLIGMSEIEETITAGILVRRYTTVESFRFLGIFTYLNHIRVAMRMTAQNERLDAHVESPGSVTLDVEYHFMPTTSGTLIQEIFHVQSPPLMTRFVLVEAVKAQNAVLTRLKQRLETPS